MIILSPSFLAGSSDLTFLLDVSSISSNVRRLTIFGAHMGTLTLVRVKPFQPSRKNICARTELRPSQIATDSADLELPPGRQMINPWWVGRQRRVAPFSTREEDSRRQRITTKSIIHEPFREGLTSTGLAPLFLHLAGSLMDDPYSYRKTLLAKWPKRFLSLKCRIAIEFANRVGYYLLNK